MVVLQSQVVEVVGSLVVVEVLVVDVEVDVPQVFGVGVTSASHEVMAQSPLATPQNLGF